MREPIPTWTFVLAIVRRGDRVLMVQERKHGGTWYLPAGRVEPGETLAAAMRREAMEEGGIPIRLTGILRLERQVEAGGAWQRVCFVAVPADERPPKSRPDAESLGAAWKTLAEIRDLPLRGGGSEVVDLVGSALAAVAVAPMDILDEA